MEGAAASGSTERLTPRPARSASSSVERAHACVLRGSGSFFYHRISPAAHHDGGPRGEGTLTGRAHVIKTACLLLAAGAALSGQTAMTPAAELRAKLERRLADLAARVDGVMGYAVLDLTS